jgi:hypothetical protein
MKKVIMVLSLVLFVFMIIVNVIYASREHMKIVNESYTLEEEVNTLKHHNEVIMELVHEEFIPKDKFIQTVDSLNTEIINRDSTLEVTNKNLILSKRKNKYQPSFPIVIPEKGTYHYHDNNDYKSEYNVLVRSDTLL